MKTFSFGSDIEFATFGRNAIAYVRRIDAKEFGERFPQAGPLPDDQDLWGLFAADGVPLAVAGEQSVLMDDAASRDLTPVARH